MKRKQSSKKKDDFEEEWAPPKENKRKNEDPLPTRATKNDAKNKCKKASHEDPLPTGATKNDVNVSDKEEEDAPSEVDCEDPLPTGATKNDINISDEEEEYAPSEADDEDPARSGGNSDDDLEADTDHEADFSEMEDAAANEDEDYPMADPELVLLDMSKKESALYKAIRAAELVAKDEVHLDDDVEDEGCIWCGDVREHERKSYVTESMNKRNLIFDDIDSLKQHATYFLDPEQPLYVDPLLLTRNYFDRALAPQPIIHVPQLVTNAATANEDATAFKGSDSASAPLRSQKANLKLQRQIQHSRVPILPPRRRQKANLQAVLKKLVEETESILLVIVRRQLCSKGMLMCVSSWMGCSCRWKGCKQ